MEHENYQPDNFDPGNQGGGGVDADAVCEACSTVNPEETFLCRTCGNNLREQKARRLSAQAELEHGGEGISHKAWLRKGFALIGILVILWTVMNLARIEDWLVSAQTSSATNPKTFWNGDSADIYDSMLDELSLAPITQEEQESSMLNATNYDGVATGRYYLVQEDSADNQRPNSRMRRNITGRALVQNDGRRALFVALIGNDFEIRGVASVEARGRLKAQDTAAFKYGNKYYSAYGVAIVNNDEGGIDCYAQTMDSDLLHSMVAYLIK